MSEMYWLYNVRQSSSLWLNLVDVKQLWEDVSVRNKRCGSHPFRCGFYTAYMMACVCTRGGHHHQLLYNVNLLFNFSFFFTVRRKDFILGWVKYVPQTRATSYSFSCECKYNPYISTMDQFKPISVQLIYLAQLPNSKFIQISLWVRTS